MRKILALLLWLMLFPALWFAVQVDMWCGASGRLNFYLIFILFGLAVALPACLIWRSVYLPGSVFLYVAALVALRFVDLSPVKPAMRVVERIQPGMSISNAVSVFNREFPVSGKFQRPALRELEPGIFSCILDPNDGRYNASILEITSTNGMCLTARFLAD